MSTGRDPARGWRIVAAALVVGVLWEALLARTGLVAYAAPAQTVGWAPPWILALWALFGSTLREPLRWLHGRPLVAAAFGAVGGALSYVAAARPGACSFDHPLPALMVLAAGWAALTPFLIGLARRWDGARHAPAEIAP